MKVFLDPRGREGASGKVEDPRKSLAGITLDPEAALLQVMLRAGQKFTTEEIEFVERPIDFWMQPWGAGDAPEIKRLAISKIHWVTVRGVHVPIFTIGPCTGSPITIHQVRGNLTIRGLSECACSVEEFDGTLDIDECDKCAFTILKAKGAVHFGTSFTDCSFTCDDKTVALPKMKGSIHG